MKRDEAEGGGGKAAFHSRLKIFNNSKTRQTKRRSHFKLRKSIKQTKWFSNRNRGRSRAGEAREEEEGRSRERVVLVGRQQEAGASAAAYVVTLPLLPPSIILSHISAQI